ncbi:hypothetical protein PZA11_004788 [Diplocarpon coronariae]
MNSGQCLCILETGSMAPTHSSYWDRREEPLGSVSSAKSPIRLEEEDPRDSEIGASPRCACEEEEEEEDEEVEGDDFEDEMKRMK